MQGSDRRQGALDARGQPARVLDAAGRHDLLDDPEVSSQPTPRCTGSPALAAAGALELGVAVHWASAAHGPGLQVSRPLPARGPAPRVRTPLPGRRCPGWARSPTPPGVAAS